MTEEGWAAWPPHQEALPRTAHAVEAEAGRAVPAAGDGRQDTAAIMARIRGMLDRCMASQARIVYAQQDALVTLHSYLIEAVALIRAGAVPEAQLLLEKQVVALDRMKLVDSGAACPAAPPRSSGAGLANRS